MRARDGIAQMQRRLSERMRLTDCADKFRAIALWWRIEALTSADPNTPRGYARASWFIAADMERRPGHHRSKPADVTRFHWCQQ